MAACLIVTLVAFNHDKDNGWLVVTAAGAALVLVTVPGAIDTALAMREPPHARRVALALLGLAVFSGAAGINLATVAGLVGTVTLIYVVGLAVLRRVGSPRLRR